METLTSHSEVFISIFIAMILGMVIGLERFFAHKTAGMRTYALISMGSALFATISQLVVSSFAAYDFDPMRTAAQVVAAAGFLGAGAILHREGRVTGITTASGLWVASAIGLACGFGLYSVAIAATFFTLFIFIVLWLIERKISNLPIRRTDDSDPL